MTIDEIVNALNGLRNADINIHDEIRYPSIMALEKQIPKKPDYIADGYADVLLCYDYAKCPICGHDFEYGINDWEADYCSDCGQKLDWKEK